jgi:hypothetical protein
MEWKRLAREKIYIGGRPDGWIIRGAHFEAGWVIKPTAPEELPRRWQRCAGSAREEEKQSARACARMET